VYKRRKTTTYRRTKQKRGLTRLVKRVITNIDEKKLVFGTNFSATTVSSASWALNSLAITSGTFPGFAQGTTSANRIGNRIRIVSWDIAVIIRPKAHIDMANGTICRFVVALDKTPAGALPANTDVFNIATSFASSYNFVNVATGASGAGQGRFSILLDKQHTMVAITAGGTESGPPLVANYRLPMKGKIIEFNGAGVLIGQLIQNNPLFLFCADAANCCDIELQSSVVFTDA